MLVENLSDIKNAITRSQHCQRNWDLTKEIPEQDLDLLIHATTQCPSKQNVAYYNVKFITNRDIIEKVHAATKGFTTDFETGEVTTNSQTLANLLVVFEDSRYIEELNKESVDLRSNESIDLVKGNNVTFSYEALKRDQNMAVGIASGYLNLTASILGYSTGCCLCFNDEEIKTIVGGTGNALLVMGIGFKDPTRNRRIHHTDSEFVFPALRKQAVGVDIIK